MADSLYDPEDDARALRLVLQLLTEKLADARAKGLHLSGFAHDTYMRAIELTKAELKALVEPAAVPAPAVTLYQRTLGTLGYKPETFSIDMLMTLLGARALDELLAAGLLIQTDAGGTLFHWEGRRPDEPSA